MRTEKTLEYEIDGDTNCKWCTRCSHQRIGTRTWGLRNKRTSRDHQTIELLRSARILRKVQKTRCHSYSREKPLASAGGKNTKGKVKKKLWNVKVTVIPVIIGALESIPRGLVKRLEDMKIRVHVETIQALLRSARILRKVLDT